MYILGFFFFFFTISRAEFVFFFKKFFVLIISVQTMTWRPSWSTSLVASAFVFHFACAFCLQNPLTSLVRSAFAFSLRFFSLAVFELFYACLHIGFLEACCLDALRQVFALFAVQELVPTAYIILDYFFGDVPPNPVLFVRLL